MTGPVVATLVAAEGHFIRDAAIEAAMQALGLALEAVPMRKDVEIGKVVDLLVLQQHPAPLRSVRLALEASLADAACDIIVQPAAHRRKKLLIADMDSTMIGQECIDELADYAGVKAEVSEITERAMQGELSFDPALRARVALLKGLPVSVIDTVLAQRISINPGATTLVRTMRAQGAITALVSGGFTLFTGPVAQKIGFAINRGNTLQHEDRLLTGTVQEPILGQESKRRTLIELAAGGVDLVETLAIGDGANDLAMIETAGLGVAYRAKPAVAAAADARLDHADLTALLFAQGYARSEFVH